MYVLDSNILIGHLNGNNSIKDWIKERITTDSLCISTISKIELLSFPGLGENNLYETEKFMNLFREINIFGDIVSLSADLKRNSNLSLPDAIILATAISRRMTLVTNDKMLTKKAKNLVEILSL
ncbi:hypothetical protein A2917_01665 [Candidatus Nomurabacteria bacterium RIFCSPLOWO2_01_FULL_42_17]|uniref:PIN domain-containing protein n=1 Tax=Candidatus Nomurabacteria bacterium RIFCSPLOWO2_01_FULL_42_17 TaxID=1801780 RepID=A0A1F6XLL8_9BACT|nr:MAG: hypothetical protein A2917_01665 [Candidatus Nomurabacteria bacterium RIFCSPLOWO2_01_FULL_42_17]